MVLPLFVWVKVKIIIEYKGSVLKVGEDYYFLGTKGRFVK
jgi:hypothetical protein